MPAKPTHAKLPHVIQFHRAVCHDYLKRRLEATFFHWYRLSKREQKAFLEIVCPPTE